MTQDFDDLEMRPREIEGTGRLPSRPRRSAWPWLGAAVLLVVAGIGAFFLTRPRPPRAAPAPEPAASPSEAPRAAIPTPDPSLPALDESDAFVRRLAAGLSTHPEVALWLARTALVRTLTAVVVNIANGETPRHHLEFLTPRQRFRAASSGDRTVADPAGYAGYDSFGDAVASVDARAAASAFTASEPLFDAAYRELGGQEAFRSVLDTAMRALLAVPVTPPDTALQPGTIGFRWVDPALEALTPAQKQFLRTGPRNVRLVQGKLRELAATLASRASNEAPAR